MIKCTFLCVGKLKEDYTKKAVADYCTRLSKYCKTDVIEVPESDIAGEGEALIKKLPERCYMIALDLHGRMLDSVEFAGLLDREMTRGASHFVFVIGGSDGIAAAVTDRADFRRGRIAVRHAPMTFTHQMSRVILAEQLYRSMKILAGETYHK